MHAEDFEQRMLAAAAEPSPFLGDDQQNRDWSSHAHAEDVSPHVSLQDIMLQQANAQSQGIQPPAHNLHEGNHVVSATASPVWLQEDRSSSRPLSLQEIQEAQKAEEAKSRAKQQPGPPEVSPGWAVPVSTGFPSSNVDNEQRTQSRAKSKQEGQKRENLVANAAVTDDGMFWEYDNPELQDDSFRIAFAPTSSAVQNNFPMLGPSEKQKNPGDATVSSLVRGQPSQAAEKESPSAFGGPMPSAEFEKWCKEQLRHLNGSDDITLVYFLCSLTSEAEVTQYVREYLGNSSEAIQFSQEFIRRNNAKNARSNTENAMVASASAPLTSKQAKKNKKKNKGGKLDASMLGFGVDASGRQLEGGTGL